MTERTTTHTIERFSRQQDIVPADRLAECHATVIGVGAVGRQVALQLAAMGISWLQLIDFDSVEESNLASQGYREDDLGRLKTDTTAESCWQLNRRLDIHIVSERFKRNLDIGNCLFCCVDSIDTRRLIWEAVNDRVRFYCDARMTAEVVRILTVTEPCHTVTDYCRIVPESSNSARDPATQRSSNDSRTHYPSTLFAQADAYQGACTAKTTIYCANIAAGLMLASFTKWLRRLPIDPDIQLNLLSNELSFID